MPPFRYEPFVNPYAPSVGELLAHQADAHAHAAEVIGQANARASEQTGAAWAGAAANIGNAVAGTIQRATDPRRQLETVQLQDLKDHRRGQAVVDALMRRGQTAPGEVGPQQDSYLTPEGLFDVPKLNQALSAQGLAHMAPDLLKGAEGINDSILKHQQLQQQAASQHTLLLGDLADGALKLAKLGMPLDKAMDFVVQPAIATKRIQPQEYAQVRGQIAALPPDQQAQALTTFMDAAAKLDKGDTLAEGAIRADRYGRVEAAGAPKPPTKAGLAVAAAGGDAAAQTALDKLTPPKNPPTLEEQLLTAKAKGDKVSEDRILATLKDAATAKRDPTATAQLEALRRLTQQEAQARLDDRDTTSDKNQQKFEQQYRTVLVRAMSSRSGGIGAEDAKVQQANHLIGMLDQFFDATTGEFNIPRVQLNELALGAREAHRRQLARRRGHDARISAAHRER
jgi:hypothetical protein